jgi:hypothetical protein
MTSDLAYKTPSEREIIAPIAVDIPSLIFLQKRERFLCPLLTFKNAMRRMFRPAASMLKLRPLSLSLRKFSKG